MELSNEDAVETVYSEDIDWIIRKLRVGLSTLVECDKQLASYLYRAIRKRLYGEIACQLISGWKNEEGNSLLSGILQELSQIIRHGKTDGIIVLLHLDLLTTTTRTGLNIETREAIAWFYENPDLVLLGFKDPNFEIPKVVENVFAVKRTILGIPREKLSRIILQREARKFAMDIFHSHRLYKYVSGLNAIRFRQVISHFDHHLDFAPHHEESVERIYHEIRELTLLSTMEIPQVDLQKDIGGYREVKTQLEENILSLLTKKDRLRDPEEVRRIEELIPRGIIFYGPPGTGKTYFAKALASSIEATLSVVSGPELKSKWVGESEENLRRIFAQARRSAPSIIVFDEIDSFASQRGMYGSSGVEHSMVNQLLTEMDGFRKEELVFVIGTTNFPEALDPALLRPGRFEFLLEIPYPEEEDRRKILEIYNDRYEIGMNKERIEYITRKTGGYADTQKGIRYSGDHLAALCREIKRRMLLKGKERIDFKDIDYALGKYQTSENLTVLDEEKIAVHESGHVLLAMALPHAKGVEKVSIDTALEIIAGYTQEKKRRHFGRETMKELKADICVALGGRAAEALIYEDISVGAWDDLRQATQIARLMVEDFGMSEAIGPRSLFQDEHRSKLSPELLGILDHEIENILKEAYEKAREWVSRYRDAIMELSKALLKKKELHSKDIYLLLKKHSIPFEEKGSLLK